MYKLLIGMLLSAVSLAAAAGADFRLADAVMRADRDTVRSLLQQKIDVNVAQPDGTTALHWAVRHDDLETARLLIRSGAKVTAPTRYGVTPLYLACVNGNAAMIDALLRAGASPNATNTGGENRPDDRRQNGQAGRCKTASRPWRDGERERRRARTDGAHVGGFGKSSRSGQVAHRE